MTAALFAFEIAPTPALLTAAGVLLLAILVLTSIPRSGRREAKRRSAALADDPLAQPMGPTGEDAPTWARTDDVEDTGTGDGLDVEAGEPDAPTPLDDTQVRAEAPTEEAPPEVHQPDRDTDTAAEEPTPAPRPEGDTQAGTAQQPQLTADTNGAGERSARPTHAVLFSEATLAAALAASHPPAPTAAPQPAGVVGDADAPEIPRWDSTWWEDAASRADTSPPEGPAPGTDGHDAALGTQTGEPAGETPQPEDAPQEASTGVVDVWVTLPDASELTGADGEGPFPPNDQPREPVPAARRRGLLARLFRRDRGTQPDDLGTAVEADAPAPSPQLGPATQLERLEEAATEADVDRTPDAPTVDTDSTDGSDAWAPQITTPPPYNPPATSDAPDTSPDPGPDQDTDPATGEAQAGTAALDADATDAAPLLGPAAGSENGDGEDLDAAAGQASVTVREPRRSWWRRLFAHKAPAHTDDAHDTPLDTTDIDAPVADPNRDGVAAAAPVMGPTSTVDTEPTVEAHDPESAAGPAAAEPFVVEPVDRHQGGWNPELDAAGHTDLNDDANETEPDADDEPAPVDETPGTSWFARLLGRRTPSRGGEEEGIEATTPLFGPHTTRDEDEDRDQPDTEHEHDVRPDDAPDEVEAEEVAAPTLTVPEHDEGAYTAAAPRLSLRARLSANAAARRAKRLGYLEDDKTDEPDDTDEPDEAPADADADDVVFVDPTSWGVATVLDDDDENIDPTSMRGAFQMSRKAEREAERAAKRAERDNDTPTEKEPETPQLPEHETIDWEALELPEPVPSPAATPARPWS